MSKITAPWTLHEGSHVPEPGARFRMVDGETITVLDEAPMRILGLIHFYVISDTDVAREQAGDVSPTEGLGEWFAAPMTSEGRAAWDACYLGRTLPCATCATEILTLDGPEDAECSDCHTDRLESDECAEDALWLDYD